MGKYTLVVESKDGRTLKIDGVDLDIRDIQVEGGMIRVTADKIIEVGKRKSSKLPW
ncbi:MAG: hypothetical protein ACE5HY_05595 [Candidatus Hydrothermarchaeales archaeon]